MEPLYEIKAQGPGHRGVRLLLWWLAEGASGGEPQDGGGSVPPLLLLPSMFPVSLLPLRDPSCNGYCKCDVRQGRRGEPNAAPAPNG